MSYNVEHARLCAKYREKGMKPTTIAAIVNKQFGTSYSAQDVNRLSNALVSDPPASEEGRLFDVAAGIVFNPGKRKKIKNIALLCLILFAIGMVLLGIFISWVPVIITISSIVGLVVLLAIVIFVLFKCGVVEKIMDKYM